MNYYEMMTLLLPSIFSFFSCIIFYFLFFIYNGKE